MKKLIMIAVLALIANPAMADSSNGVPSPYGSNKSRAQSPIGGNAGGWLREKVRVHWLPQFIAEPQSYNTRKYGTAVGYCTPVKRSSGGKVGRFFGWGYLSKCR